MKRILLFLAFTSSFLFSEVVFSNIDECKTDVYFGNGILTIKEDAIINAGILRKAIKKKFGLNLWGQNLWGQELNPKYILPIFPIFQTVENLGFSS